MISEAEVSCLVLMSHSNHDILWNLQRYVVNQCKLPAGARGCILGPLLAMDISTPTPLYLPPQ